MNISAWWNLASRKLKKSDEKFNRKTSMQRQLLSESGSVLRIAPPALSRDRRRMKMIKSEIINQKSISTINENQVGDFGTWF